MKSKKSREQETDQHYDRFGKESKKKKKDKNEIEETKRLLIMNDIN